MCGIGGILYSTEGRDSLHKKISLIQARQQHRGPDEQRSLVFDRHAFCHQRLSIIDAPGGQQPFYDASGRYLIVYNGELYNYLELKKALSENYPFQTNSDTEVILAAYLVWGEACLQRFNGMFAFLIWDTKLETAFAARDPLGVKPFVYTYQRSTFIFASEVKALIPVIESSPDIDLYMLAEYLIAPSLSGGGDKSILKNICYLEPGTYLQITPQGIHTEKYYRFNWHQSALNENALVHSMTAALEQSVLLSLRSDVPIGIFLSGGLDSSLIAAIAAKQATPPSAAFSIAFTNHKDLHFDPSTIVNSDDLPYAFELAQQLGLPLQPITAHHPSLFDSLNQLSIINDRIPAWEQEISQHFLSREASKHVKTVLVGDAADETNYGYFFLLNEEITNSPLGLITQFGGAQRIDLLAPHLQKQLKPLDYLENHYRNIANQSGFDFKKGGVESILAMSTLVHRRWLERLLHNGDIHTMRFGLEARVPFSNRNVLDIACQVYPNHGFKGGVEKSILRKAAARWLPPHFCTRKKSALPRDPRHGNAYQEILRKLLAEKNNFVDAYLNRKTLTTLCDLKVINENDRMSLFNVISIILWARNIL